MEFAYLTFAEVPKTLYHYTSLEALVAIVQTKRLRASNIRFLNDTSESLRLKQDVIEILQRRASSSEEQQMLASLIERIAAEPHPSFFVASLSEKHDLLSQWRAYCPSGVGVSIGFSSDSLSEQWIANPSGGKPFFLSASLQKVRYYASDHQGELEKMIEKLLDQERTVGPFSAFASALVRSDEMFSEEPFKRAVEIIADVEGNPAWKSPPPLSAIRAWVTLLSPFIKHDAFQEECEWRKVISKDAGSKVPTRQIDACPLR